jgi:hypothetical protein
MLAAAFIARAAMRRGAHRFGRDWYGPWGWGPSPEAEEWRRSWKRHGGPWGYGGRHGWRDYGHGSEEGQRIRSEIGELVSLLRDTVRRGGPSAAQVGQIREVITDARKRITAILAETDPHQTMV